MAGRSKRSEVFPKFAVLVKQLMRLITPHPVFELEQMFGVVEVRDRHLVRPPCPFHRYAINVFWSGPPFGRDEDDHRPARSLRPVVIAAVARRLLDAPDLRQSLVERSGELLMDLGGIVTFDEQGGRSRSRKRIR